MFLTPRVALNMVCLDVAGYEMQGFTGMPVDLLVSNKNCDKEENKPMLVDKAVRVFMSCHLAACKAHREDVLEPHMCKLHKQGTLSSRALTASESSH